MLQCGLDCFSEAYDNFGLTISTKKIKVKYHPAPGKPYQEPLAHIKVKEQNLQAVDNFTYLGSTFSQAVNIDVEVNNRIDKASAVFERLRVDAWERRGISLITDHS